MLEKLAFGPESRLQALTALVSGHEASPGLVAEAVILSTCNRVELYVAAPACSLETLPLGSCFAGPHGLVAEAAPYLYTYTGAAAACHLFAVASGLDSMIVGEPQIMGQVRQAYEAAREARAAGPLLTALFQRALATGKRVRSQTRISQRAASVSYAAVELAARHLGDLSSRRVLIIGAGRTGQLAAQCLAGRGVRDVTVANRSLEHAAALAAQWGGAARGLDGLEEALQAADIVISCTNAPGYVVTEDMVRHARAGREEALLFMLDIAMPRDVEPSAGALAGVRLFNIDDLRAVVAENLDQRQADGRAAQGMIDGEVADFMEWLQALAVTPLISDLRQQAEGIRRHELERAMHRLEGLPENYASIVDLLTRRIVNQMLHQPTVRLKQHASRADGQLYAQALRDLFGLGDAPGPEG